MCLLLLLVCFIAPIQAMDLSNLFYMKSVDQCSNHKCQIEDYFHYYNCNIETCDFHLQPWIFAIISFIVISFLCSLVCSLLNCICCRERPHHSRRYP
uniref:Uncharacterized protein n=1 Tax=Ditylenchus dipsaci TaxID=166011 RepID=A0A915EDK2_9BILA